MPAAHRLRAKSLNTESYTNAVQKQEKQREQTVQQLTSWQNPFVSDTETADSLIHLPSGIVANAIVHNDILSAKDEGEKALKQFLEKRQEDRWCSGPI